MAVLVIVQQLVIALTTNPYSFDVCSLETLTQYLHFGPKVLHFSSDIAVTFFKKIL